MSDVVLVDNPEALSALIERVKAAPRVGIDTEFHNERSYSAQLMVVQLAFDDGVAIVDPLALSDLHPLMEVLAATEVVGHALSSDLRILAEDYGTLPQRAFDTQVAAAFCGYGLTISLLDLVRELAGVTLRKSQTVSDWSTRPLSPKQIDYLVDDVRYLFTLADRLELCWPSGDAPNGRARRCARSSICARIAPTGGACICAFQATRACRAVNSEFSTS